MATRLPAILDHLSALLEGRVSGLDRHIEPRQFSHADFPVEYTLPRTAKRPVPFHLSGLQWFRPDDIEENVAGDEVYRGLRFSIRIGYALKPHEEYIQQKAIIADAHALHRCLSDPDSWDAAVGFARFYCSEPRIVLTEVVGANVDQPELMQVLEVPCELTYRENYT